MSTQSTARSRTLFFTKIALAAAPLALCVAASGCAEAVGVGELCRGINCSIELASNQFWAKDLVLDAQNIYWMNWDKRTLSHTGIWTMPKVGGTPIHLVVGNPTSLALDADNIYWTDQYGGVFSMPKRGGATVTYAPADYTSPCESIAVDSSNVYWTNADSGEVMAVPKGGDAPEPLATEQDFPVGIATDGTFVFWLNAGDGKVMKLSRRGIPERLASDQVGLVSLVLDATTVYFSNNIGSISKVSKLGPADDTAPLVSPPSSPHYPYDLAVDPTHIYWIRDEKIMRTSIEDRSIDDHTERPIETMFIDQGEPLSVAVDTDFVYWTTGDGFVRKGAK